MPATETFSFTPESFEQFKALYKEHEHDPNAVFTFEGHEFLVGYAKYVIEYVEAQISTKH